MLNRDYVLIISLVKKLFRYCGYILLSRNREKQLGNKSNKVTKEAILKACAYKKHCKTLSDSNRKQAKKVLFLNFN